MDHAADLAAARAAIEARDWAGALSRFALLDADGALHANDLVVMGDAAFWSGDPDRAIGSMQRARAAYLAEGALTEAAEAALVICRLYVNQFDLAVSAGWLECARRELEAIPECKAHAHLAYLDAYATLLMKDYEAAAAAAGAVETLATRVGDREHAVLARALQGFVATHAGDIPGGMRLLDEASAFATAGELSLFAGAEIVCEMIVSSLDVADYERASAWLDEAERSGAVVSFPGCCRVHRTSLLRHRGEWDEARETATLARAEVAGVEAMHEGMVLTEIGELSRARGDLALAEDAFALAYDKGWFPQPGLALVQLAKKEPQSAARMIDRAVEHALKDRSALVWLLPAQVEIALAAGDRETAEHALERLNDVAAQLGTSAATAAVGLADGRLRADAGDWEGAARALDDSVHKWQRARNPYEAARTRLLLATALEELGDSTSARLELVAARTAFESLGAKPHAVEAARRIGDEQAAHMTCTFLFTDIVNSTELLTTIGDDSWAALHRWHHRMATTIFGEHHGTTVKDTGDGFFVVFEDATQAVDGAIALQRALARHRLAEGFAPSVRIGIHAGTAVFVDNDYRGRDVVIAARLEADSEADGILVSDVVAGRVSEGIRATRLGVRNLKGIPEPVEVVAIDWRT